MKTAYKTLALVCHPDKGGDVDKFRKIDNAYKLLCKHFSKADCGAESARGTKRPRESGTEATSAGGARVKRVQAVQSAVDKLFHDGLIMCTAAFVSNTARCSMWLQGRDSWTPSVEQSAGAMREEIRRWLVCDFKGRADDRWRTIDEKDVTLAMNLITNTILAGEAEVFRSSSAVDMRKRARGLLAMEGGAIVFNEDGTLAIVEPTPLNALVLRDEVIPARVPRNLSAALSYKPANGAPVLRTCLETLLGAEQLTLFLDCYVHTLRGKKTINLLIFHSVERSVGKTLLVAILNLVHGSALCPIKADAHMFSKVFLSQDESTGAKRTLLLQNGRAWFLHIDDAHEKQLCWAAVKAAQSPAGKLLLAHTTGSVPAMVVPLIIASTNDAPDTLISGGDESTDRDTLVFEFSAAGAERRSATQASN